MKFKYIILLALLSLFFYSCDKDEPEIVEALITLEDQTFEVLETITDADEIGRLAATSNMADPITYRIVENADELFSLTEDGVLGLATGKRFHFKTANSHQIVVEATDGSEIKTATITISVINVPYEFVTQWKTNNIGVSNDNQVKITTVTGLAYDYNIDWGDGSEDTNVTGDITHSYATEGVYTVSITGTFPGIYNEAGVTDNQKLISIDQWGYIEWQTMASAFKDCSQVVLNATDAPNLSQVTSMNTMFRGADLLNADLSNWDVSNITDMSFLFQNCDTFNGDISNWDVSSVTTMAYMFQGAPQFNGDLNHWDVSQVTSMQRMFSGAQTFNSDLDNWDVSSVTQMHSLFQQAASFNGNISTWDLASATNLSFMFEGASSFDGDISSWNVSHAILMFRMFYNASSFDGDLSNWDISSVTNMDNMLEGTSFSTTSYDSLLSGWSNLNVTNNVAFSVGNVQYSAISEAARNVLTDSYGWNITDGGIVP